MGEGRFREFHGICFALFRFVSRRERRRGACERAEACVAVAVAGEGVYIVSPAVLTDQRARNDTTRGPVGTCANLLQMDFFSPHSAPSL